MVAENAMRNDYLTGQAETGLRAASTTHPSLRAEETVLRESDHEVPAKPMHAALWSTSIER